MFDNHPIVGLGITGGSCSEDFENLSAANFMRISKSRKEEIINFAHELLAYSFGELGSRVNNPYKALTFKEKYHLASAWLRRIYGNKLILDGLINRKVFTFNDDIERSLLAMIICDEDCKYYELYDAKRKEGFSREEALDYLGMYFGIRSPKLVQLERYYQVLDYRHSKNVSSIYDDSVSLPKR